MTDQELKRIYEKARGIACGRGYSEFAEDIAQEVVIKAARLGFSPKIEWEITNILRKEYGDLRSNTGRAKQRGTRYAVRLDAPVDDDNETLGHDLIGSEHVDPLPEPGLERFAGLFSGIEATVFELICIEEYTHKEFADLYGMNLNTVHQWAWKVRRKLIKAMLPEELPEAINFELEDIAI